MTKVMTARLKSSYRWDSILLFGGTEFVKSESRIVPAGFEKEAEGFSDVLEIKYSEKIEEPVVVLDGLQGNDEDTTMLIEADDTTITVDDETIETSDDEETISSEEVSETTKNKKRRSNRGE